MCGAKAGRSTIGYTASAPDRWRASPFSRTPNPNPPHALRARLLWAAAIAPLSFDLTAWFKAFDAPIWALFASAPFTAWLDRCLPGARFRWRPVPTAGRPP